MFNIQETAIRLVEERARLGLSQNSVAERTGKSRGQYINYETGRSEMTVGFLFEIFQLGFDVQYIITGISSQNIQESYNQKDMLQEQTNNIQGNMSGVIAGSGSTIHQVNTQKHVTKTIADVKPGIEHITNEQRAHLKQLVDEIVELEKKYRTTQSAKGHQAVWASLNKKMKVPKYSLIPLDKYEVARKHLQSWIGRLSDTRTARKTDTNATRRRQYAYIHTNLQKLGLEDWYRNYLQERHGVVSSTELDDVRLKQAYQAVAYKVRRANK